MSDTPTVDAARKLIREAIAAPWMGPDEEVVALDQLMRRVCEVSATDRGTLAREIGIVRLPKASSGRPFDRSINQLMAIRTRVAAIRRGAHGGK